MAAIIRRNRQKIVFPAPVLTGILLCMVHSQETRSKGTSQTRIGRYSGQSQIYHVSTATFERRAIFEVLQNGRIVVQAMRCVDTAGHTETMAYVVMPDHLHWLFQLTGDRSLSDSVCVVKSHSARLINALTRKKQKIWQRGFYDRAVRKDEDLLSIARYIVANPLRARIVDSVADYPLWDVKWI